ncbi:MAG: bifunctional UDP-3-O-[3-hydroxymyristoyl] N-acetylglucosamine deacetylase/3-hydroxyacyl-ACP dehydratase [Gemmatimonadetes bacterium]|nr:bifunctional UDP-3-O-[3-hydroxymyristoyl] N-acetylglucosamine deacetylase/3-hydroxyacyl-ACP dehydratase [Gemmatimonadota bacterium]
MSVPKQRTVSREITLEGVGLHSGASCSLTFRAGEPGTGVQFRRTDLAGSPQIPADLAHVRATELGTTLGAGEATVMTVEHVLAALAALEIDNAVLDVSGPEVPILDGSFQTYVAALGDARPVEQAVDARVVTVSEPVAVSGKDGQSYVATRGDGLRVSASIDFGHAAIGRQFGSFAVGREVFREALAPARTFGFAADAEPLRARGLARGASLENTVVLDENGVMNPPLRFQDEFLRHKVGDLVGDLALLGARIHAHVVAERPSHKGNITLAKAIDSSARQTSRVPVLDTAQIMKFLPHRYPMLLVDRITEIEEGKRIVGIKNVTINEPFFQGHYPGHPIMPGVLIVEAMAQVGGLLLMKELGDAGDKVVYFMTMDNVKFRRPVVPGDTLVFELEVLQLRRGVCKMRGEGRVEGKVAAEAEFMASIVDK